MSIYFRAIRRLNGDVLYDHYVYSCSKCRNDVDEMWPRVEHDDFIYCIDCALILGIISKIEWLQLHHYNSTDRVEIHDGEVYSGPKNYKFPWEQTSKDIRTSKEYRAWRKAVLERDDYVCQKCGKRHKRGINAHHKKLFSKYPALRFSVKNGETLCDKCHKSVHRKSG